MARLKVKRVQMIVPIDLYCTSLLVCIGHSHEQFMKAAENASADEKLLRKLKKLPDTAGGWAIEDKKGHKYIIWIADEMVSTAGQYGLLNHEIFHIVDYILRRTGMKLCNKTCEAYAYLTGYLTSEIYSRMWTQTSLEDK